MSDPRPGPRERWGRGLKTARSRLFARRLAHGSAGAAVGIMACVLAGFMRISFDPAGAQFFWAERSVTYVLNEAGAADVPDDDSDLAAVRLGFRAWEELPGSSIAFSEDVAADDERRDYEAFDVHLVLWDEDGSTGLFPSGSSIVALTPLIAGRDTGQLFDADIIFNGGLPFSTDLTSGTFDVQSVATHEVGHFIGFDHAGGPLTTMNSTITSGSDTPRSLSRDEETAAAHVYPGSGVVRGRISGTVLVQGAGGVRYGQVVAVDEATGELAGGAVTDAGGNYSIEGLPAGSYSVYAEPLDGPFRASATIALATQPADSFATTFAPGGPIPLGQGGQATATFSVDPTASLTITDSSGARVSAGGTTSFLVRGANLPSTTASRVTGSGVTAQHEVVGSDLLRITVTASSSATRGVRCLVLENEDQVAVLTAAVEVQDEDPTVTEVTPTSLDPLGGEQLSISGGGFTPGCDVVVGGQLATQVTFVSSNQLRCTTPPSPGVTSLVDVVVIRPDGREARAVSAVAYRADPRPTSVDPARGPLAGGTRHRVLGTGFAAPADVLVGGRPAQVLEVSSFEVEFVLPAGSAPGPVDVIIRAGDAEGFLANGLVYVDAPAPRVTVFSPTSGPTSGGTLVTLVGEDFAPDATVTFDDLAGGGVSVSPAGDVITVVTPPHAAAGVEVRVTNPATGLVGIAPELFSYAGPTILAGGGGGGSSGGCALTPPSSAPAPRPTALLGLLVGAILFGRFARRG